MGMCSRRPTRVRLTKCHRQLRRQWAREHRDWIMDEWKRVAWSDEPDFSFITSMIVSGVRCLPGEQLLPSCTAGWWWQFYALGDVLMGGSGTRSCGRTDHESCELTEHH
ncbi:hypothetical protein AVEN_133398-1 [Araneus ventricosus]|uniref:Transposase Tc1-like domain-containing protein n=1 Tax=Araneus ventricosus TaxID=182803 RepID=A0A4Y2EDR4_ARAVE|nr:hypothetical protein AVEN_133398-1 [Araneus ventricosus]